MFARLTSVFIALVVMTGAVAAVTCTDSQYKVCCKDKPADVSRNTIICCWAMMLTCV